MSRSRIRCLPTVGGLGALGLAALWQSACVAAQTPPVPSVPSVPANANDARETEGGRRAAERAQQALEARQQWIPGLTLESVTATQWSDSSLGCRKPGMSYMQVITSGYTVKYVGKDARREVHVSDKGAVVCGGTLRGGAPRVSQQPVRVRLRQLDAMTEAARTDLATRIGAKPDSISVISSEPVHLPARVIRCEVATDAEAPVIPAYKFVLRHEDREFTYHSDLTSVFACPPIMRE